ncbi:MAG: OmpH family outer membrane protein [Candidatus Eisenbacteria bacterium]|uniref:OmpH family outer membrane protein n=1 Tax=Eiseniibacteriota bacterium TaxID=2212470 RepID=A0A933SB84_UNCEI|nr:OmpH family outer membrane protein [Candidatus Eisenbacteria bacterium]
MRFPARVLAFACALLTAATAVFAADLSVGYIDSSRIFMEYKDAQDAQQRFDRQVQGWRDEATEKEKVVTQLRAELRDQGPILSALKRQEKETALQRAVTEYENFIQEIWGPNGRASQENERATGEVVQQIRAAVEKVAGQKGLTMVFDSTSGVLVYADRTLDITADVLAELAARTAGTTR